ncbi:hypothetical protein GQ53DRAFT_748176 [Thozetella sp. PMI_491]|nr:hypothetical protein GQ53DRAFT_748176 [Thozetella sp. PMI_491]
MASWQTLTPWICWWAAALLHPLHARAIPIRTLTGEDRSRLPVSIVAIRGSESTAALFPALLAHIRPAELIRVSAPEPNESRCC